MALPNRKIIHLITASVIALSALILILGFKTGLRVSSFQVRTAIAAEIVLAGSIFLLTGGEKKATLQSADTLMKTRTVEDVEKLLEEAEEKNRTLLANSREATALIREKQQSLEDLECYSKFLEAGLDYKLDNFGSACKSLLLQLRSAFRASAAAVWIVEQDAQEMFVAGTSGELNAQILEQPIRTKAAMLPSDLRRLCEEQMRFAAPPSQDVPVTFLPVSEDIIDPPVDQSPHYLGCALRLHDQIIGVVVLAPAPNCRFQQKELARLNYLSGAFALALYSIGNRPEVEAVVETTTTAYEIKKS